MGLRFKFLAAVYLMLMMIATNGEFSLFGGAADVFIGLAILLVLSVIALWPNSGRGEQVDRALSGTNWADRIDIERRRDERSPSAD